MKLYGVFGAGGFGREVMPLAEHCAESWNGDGQDAEVVFVVEDQFAIPDKAINGHRVIHMSDFLTMPVSERRFNIAIGNSVVRERIANAIPADLATPFPIFAPSYLSLHGNSIGEGAIFCSYTHVTSNATIGRYFHGNIYAYVAHDCVIGDFVTFAPGVKCNGNVVIEDHAYIGAGAVIRDGSGEPIVIGRGAVIGMGAVVTKSVAPGLTVIGNPARPLHRSGR